MLSLPQKETKSVDKLFRLKKLRGMISALSIAELRAEKNLTLGELADYLGLKSKGHVSRIEQGEACSVAVALKIEKLSDGRIAAASLSRDVALVDEARGIRHAAADTASPADVSVGNGTDLAAPMFNIDAALVTAGEVRKFAQPVDPLFSIDPATVADIALRSGETAPARPGPSPEASRAAQGCSSGLEPSPSPRPAASQYRHSAVSESSSVTLSLSVPPGSVTEGGEGCEPTPAEGFHSCGPTPPHDSRAGAAPESCTGAATFYDDLARVVS